MGVTYPNMVNLGPRDTVPEKFKERQFYIHNPIVTRIRTTPEECAAIGKETNHINDVEFAETAAGRLIEMMEGKHERIGPKTKNEV